MLAITGAEFVSSLMKTAKPVNNVQVYSFTHAKQLTSSAQSVAVRNTTVAENTSHIGYRSS
jgi:hypothetical protein